MNNASKFTFIDLFAGIGGFRMALNNIGGRCLNFSEINKDAIATYCENFDEGFDCNLGDITRIKALPKHDLLTAGVPCQSWSIAGKNLGFDDDRGQLWNDTIYLLNQARPKAFIFENVKGLVDPRNKEALNYILKRIKEAGYFASYYVLNSFEYGVPQNRVRIYIVGFLEEKHHSKFTIPKPTENKVTLADILNIKIEKKEIPYQTNLFGDIIPQRSMSLSNNNGFNDYFLFNDLRNGHSTIHSWDIIETTERQKNICYLLLKNRRKITYGNLDGNPLSLRHFQELDNSITQNDLEELVKIGILKSEEYQFEVDDFQVNKLTNDEKTLIDFNVKNKLIVDILKSNKLFKINNISISKTIRSLQKKEIIRCIEVRYDFKNTKISTGLFGVNRIFLPSSNIFPTLVASDTNDFITLKNIEASDETEYKNKFISEIYQKGNYRKITKEEACLIQGFPPKFVLPENRAKWMKLLGNSVSVPVIEILATSILETGVFESDFHYSVKQNSLAKNQSSKVA
jgi:DNA (cytosine-5)-methyltransferase 1